jgi:hypothetical protein
MSDLKPTLERARGSFLVPDLRIEQVLRRSDRHRRNQRIAAGVMSLIIAAALALTFAVTPRQGAAPAASTHEAPPTATAGPLEGAWQTRAIRPAQVTAFLKDHGLGDAAPTVITDEGYPARLTLHMIGLYSWMGFRYSVTRQDGQVIDIGSYEIHRDRIAFLSDSSDSGKVVYRWTREVDALSLTFLRDTAPDYRGYPDEAFHRAIFEMSAFRFVR